MKRHNREVFSIVLHHTETPNEPPAMARARLRGIQNYHRNRGWGDIAYHYLIDPAGNIYTGRDPEFAGDSGTKYDLDGRILVCLLGNFMEEKPGEEALSSLVSLVSQLLEKYSLRADDVVTHQDVAATDCPGTKFQEWIKSSGILLWKAVQP